MNGVSWTPFPNLMLLFFNQDEFCCDGKWLNCFVDCSQSGCLIYEQVGSLLFFVVLWLLDKKKIKISSPSWNDVPQFDDFPWVLRFSSIKFINLCIFNKEHMVATGQASQAKKIFPEKSGKVRQNDSKIKVVLNFFLVFA